MRFSRSVRGAAAIAWLALAPTARALDLDTVLGEVAARHPALEAQRSMADAARSRVAPAGAWASPLVALGVNNVPVSGGLDRDPMTMRMVELSQRVPVFGANRLARGAARAAYDAELSGIEAERRERFGAAYEAYAAAFYAGALLRESALHRGVMDRMVESARARYTAGNGRLEDVLRAEADRARVLADAAGFAAEEREARAHLARARGLDADDPADTLAPLPAATAAGAEEWAVGIERHPRLTALDATISRDRLAARASRRAVWPDLELRAAYGFRERLADGTPQDDMVSASLGLTLPVFARSRELAEGAERDAMARAGEAERRAAAQEIGAELTAALAAAEAAGRTVSLLADTVVVTQRRAVEAAWSGYTAGTTDLWRALEMAHGLYADELSVIRARQDLARARARLLTLTGRGELLGLRMPAPERRTP